MPTLVLIWKAHDQLLASDAAATIEVLPPLACRPVAGVPNWIRGLFLHRGTLTPLIDADRLLAGLSSASGPAVSDRMRNRILVLRLSRGEESPEVSVGLWIQTLLGLEHVQFDGGGAHPGFSTASNRFLGPVASTKFGLAQLVRPDELLGPEHLRVLDGRSREDTA